MLKKNAPNPAIAYYPRQEEESMGTTLIAVETKDAVVLGTDSRTSTGIFIASRVTDKITPLNDRMVLLRAGTTSDSQALSDIIIYFAEAFEIMDEEPVTVHSVAMHARKFHYNYREQVDCSLIVAGYDDKKKGQIYSISQGGYTQRQPMYFSGSGSTHVFGFMAERYDPKMTVDEAKKIVKQAVFLAQLFDSASGGVIHLAVIDKNGTHKQILRPDSDEFPKEKEIPGYPNLPQHIQQSGFVQDEEEVEECEE